MKTFNRLPIIILLVLCISVLAACNKDDEAGKGMVNLIFSHVVEGQQLVIGDQEYTNAAGNKYKVEELKYYVSSIRLTRADGSSFFLPDGYYLIEEASLSQRREIEIRDVPVGNYTSVSFAIGVDSARNFSTQLVGELNPNNDMAWNWVSGYKFFLIEGRYTTVSNVTDAFVYHIGGNQSYRTVSLTSQNGSFAVSSDKTTEIAIKADVSQVFKATTPIDLNTIQAVMEPGDQADKVANNYAGGMFQIQQVQTK